MPQINFNGPVLTDNVLLIIELEQVGRHTCCAICHEICKCELRIYKELKCAFGGLQVDQHSCEEYTDSRGPRG